MNAPAPAGGGYREVAPHPALRPFVECFWVAAEPVAASPRDILPDGCVDLLVDCAAATGWLVGAMTRPHAFAADGPVAIAAVRFRPGGAAPFVGAELDAFTDAQVPLGDVARWLGDLAGRTIDAVGPAQAVAALQAALLARLPPPPDGPIDRALARLVAAPAGARIDALAADAGITRQHFARQVQRRTGLSPKQLATILRLRAALPDVRGAAPLAQVAADHGYADQAHLARALRGLAGASARELRGRSG